MLISESIKEKARAQARKSRVVTFDKERKLSRMASTRNSTIKDINVAQVQVEDLHLMCVDPLTAKTFHINMGTHEAIEIQLSEKKKIPNKIKREKYKVDELLDRKEHETNWDFQNAAVNDYRRRMVPFYLLGDESNQYPVYIDNKDIPAALIAGDDGKPTEDGILLPNIKINMSDSLSANYSFNLNNVSLFATADQLIKMCKHKLQKQNQLSDQTKIGGRSWKNLKNNAMLSDDTIIAGKLWREIKKDAMAEEKDRQDQDYFERLSDNDYALALLRNLISHQKKQDNTDVMQRLKIVQNDIYFEKNQFKELTENEKDTVKQLIEAQSKQADMNPLKKIHDNNQAEDPNQMSMLKFKNYDSYLYGSHQLVYFVELRKFLSERGKRDKEKPLELVFLTWNGEPDTKKKVDHKEYNFPPLIDESHSKQHQYASTKTFRFKPGSGRASTIAAPPPKSFEQMMETRYRHVSIFGWYPPKELSDAKKPLLQSVNYTQEDWAAANQAHGNMSFLRYPNLGIRSYQANGEILRSCDIYEPLRVKLLCLKNLSQTLKRFVQLAKNNKPQEFKRPQIIPLIGYVVPIQSDDDTQTKISSLLSRVAMRRDKKDDMGLKKAHCDPFANFGINEYYRKGFEDIQFRLQHAHGVKKAPSKSNFTMMPKYIQIQAALYLGCRRISCFSYSKPSYFGNVTELDNEFLTFRKPKNMNKLQRQEERNEDALTPEDHGELLDIAQLPSFTRLCMNIIIIPEKDCKIVKQDTKLKDQPSFVRKEGFVFGSIQMSLFDENFLLRQGKNNVRIWPFEQYDPRIVCQGEYFGAKDTEKEKEGKLIKDKHHRNIMNLQVEFQSFASQVGWRLQDQDNQLSAAGPTNDEELPENVNILKSKMGSSVRLKSKSVSQNLNKKNSSTLTSQLKKKHVKEIKRGENKIEKKAKTLQQIKCLLDTYPRDVNPEDAEKINQNVGEILEHRNYIYKLPVYIRLIDFTDQKQLKNCYEVLESDDLGKDMTPEEALALLDGEFGDVKVRLFAVQKLAQLSDLQIALVMPQLVQALKYELFHHSPLSEFLLEKSIANTRVIGQAFFWALKACLSRPYNQVADILKMVKNPTEKQVKEKDHETTRITNRLCMYNYCQERYFLIQERFLMCCGMFKNDIYKQNLFNNACIKVSNYVLKKLEDKRVSKDLAKTKMHKKLKEEEIKIKMLQQLVLTHSHLDDKKYRQHGYRPHDSIIEGNRSVNQTDINNSNVSIREDQLIYEFDEIKINKFIESNVRLIFDSLTKSESDKDAEKPDKILYVEDVVGAQETEVDWNVELLYNPLEPKMPLQSFARKGGTIFMSKKKPLLIECKRATEKETEIALRASKHQLKHAGGLSVILEERNTELMPNQKQEQKPEERRAVLKFMFKTGDDLKQDNLVLQFFKIMDEIWRVADQDYAMNCYNVMETGFETGYIEFVDGAVCLTQMHDAMGLFGPYKEMSVMNYFIENISKQKFIAQDPRNEDELAKKRRDYLENYCKSVAGQGVATYVLGIGDRHPGNYMLQEETGKFFHIDFGHFLNHPKKFIMKKVKRDREPFIMSPEMQYFMEHFHEIKWEEDKLGEQTMIRGTPWSKFKTHAMKPDFKDNFKHEYHGYTDEEKKTVKEKARVKPYSEDEKFIIQELIDHQSHPQFKQDGNYLEIPEDKKKPFDPKRWKCVYDKNNKGEMSEKDKDFAQQFEDDAIKAFTEIRKNADTLVNLLTLMIVCDLEELDQASIDWLKDNLFLDVSEEEAQVLFKLEINKAKNSAFPSYRPTDNVFHIISDRMKESKLEKRAQRAKKEAEKEAEKEELVDEEDNRA